MKTAIVTLDSIPTSTQRGGSHRALNAMVAALGLMVALGGFFSRSVTWAFLGAI